MKRLSILFVVVMLAASATIAMAGPRRCETGMGPGGGIGSGCDKGPYALSSLNLSAEQAAKIQALREARFKEVSPLQNQIFSKRTELRLQWIQIDPDQGKIKAKQKEISNLRDQIQEKTTKYRLKLRNTLTPEQRAQIMAFRLERGCGTCGKCAGRMGCW